MKSFLLIIIAFFVATSGENYGLHHFSKDEKNLQKCIEDRFKIFRSYRDSGMREYIELIINQFSGRTLTRDKIHSLLTECVEFLDDNMDYKLTKNEILRFQLEESILEALIACSEDDADDGIESVNDRLLRRVLSHFNEEVPSVGRILDYILVNWLHDLKYMVSIRPGRALLRRYAEDVLPILEQAYSGTVQDIFHKVLRRAWTRRAELFFDARNVQFPYIDHIYTKDHLKPHTHGDVTKLFFNLSAENYQERIPQVSRTQVDEVLNVYAVKDFNITEFGHFSNYDRYGMSSAEYYYEIHRIQLYRVLFFCLELMARDIVTDKDDTFNWRISQELQKITYDDEVYRNYLFNRRRYELNIINDTEHTIYRHNLEQSVCVREEDLVLLLWNGIKKRVLSTTTPSTSTSTNADISSTPKNPELSKEGSAYENKFGKHFLKKQGEFVDRCDENNCENIGKISSKNIVDSQWKTKINYKKYVTHLDNFKHLLSSADESSFFMISLGGII